MKGKRHTPEQIIRKLRDADAMLAVGKSIGQVAQALEVSEQTFHRWRNQYGWRSPSLCARASERIRVIPNRPACPPLCNRRKEKLCLDQYNTRPLPPRRYVPLRHGTRGTYAPRSRKRSCLSKPHHASRITIKQRSYEQKRTGCCCTTGTPPPSSPRPLGVASDILAAVTGLYRAGSHQ